MTEPSHLLVAVDRIEGSKAILEDDDGTSFTVDATKLTPRPREGSVYRVPIGADGKPAWSAAVNDPAEAKRRLDELNTRMKKLTRRDDGGDIEL